ncbi:MAG: mechanosensitive ion channel [Calditrichaceae bacterium]|nr:mechanosensitive ion channel [Calditrichaceae bacterium]MBN2710308.1 mechanosensitive ion channel [Calditrichaceae bacterium]RQV93010.1 MAG: mechanosensitive ion channel family protein [Calditrichota bacterium]
MTRIIYLFFLIIIFFTANIYGQAIDSIQNQAADSVIVVDTVRAANEEKTSVVDEITSGKPKIQWTISFSKIFWSIVIFLIALIVIRIINHFMEKVAEQWSNLRLFVKRLMPVIRITGWTFAIYVIIAGVLAPPIETLIALTASAGIAVGFASQDILKNIFGGIMILFDRPFQVGDKIAIGNYYGEVIQIGLRTVRIITADDSQVSIPNGELVNRFVSNSNSGEFNCQVVAEFFLPAHIDINRLKQIARKAAAVSKYVYLKKPIAVIIKNEIYEGRSLLKVRLKAYVMDLRYEYAFASDMTERVMKYLFKEKMITAEEMNGMHAI